MGNPYGQVGTHPADLPIGIIIIILYGLIAIISLLGFLGGAAVGGSGTVGAGVAGGSLMILSLILLIVSGLMVTGGAGIIKGARWGFMICGIMAVLSIIVGFFGFNGTIAVVRLLIAAALATYCFLRLGGQIGPRPN